MISHFEQPGGNEPERTREVREDLRCEFPYLKRPLDSANHFGVAVCEDQFGIMRIPVRWLDREEAINLAAWLMITADPTRERFERVVKEIAKT